MATSKSDEFANYAILSVTESAANTLTFKKLETGISLSEKVAWIINRVEYIVASISAAIFNADTDTMTWGLSLSNSFAAPAFSEDTIIDYNLLARLDLGVAASGGWLLVPFLKDFSRLPGGGLLVPPTPLYLWAKGSGLTAANIVTARIHYQLMSMSTDQYWQLVEARRVISS